MKRPSEWVSLTSFFFRGKGSKSSQPEKKQWILTQHNLTVSQSRKSQLLIWNFKYQNAFFLDVFAQGGLSELYCVAKVEWKQNNYIQSKRLFILVFLKI